MNNMPWDAFEKEPFIASDEQLDTVGWVQRLANRWHRLATLTKFFVHLIVVLAYTFIFITVLWSASRPCIPFSQGRWYLE